jgi:hypothetical protein
VEELNVIGLNSGGSAIGHVLQTHLKLFSDLPAASRAIS